ncbi:MAG TPA: GDP-mannose 4,6-dehydratase, partial [Longimicrobiaceae bacterium]
QRPDLVIHKFTRLISEGAPIPVYGDGSTRRDYTYVDDILQGVEAAIAFTAAEEPVFEIVHLGESETTSLNRLIELISAALGQEPVIERHPLQPGDVERTYADISRARSLLGYAPTTKVEQGIPKFVEWFRQEEQIQRGGREGR